MVLSVRSQKVNEPFFLGNPALNRNRNKREDFHPLKKKGGWGKKLDIMDLVTKISSACI
jgi:hypothetical protein